MRRLRDRYRRRSRSALETPVSWLFLVSLLILVLLWRTVELFTVVTMSCGANLRFWQGWDPMGPSLAGLFALTFTASFTVWFVDLIRLRHQKPSWVLAGVQALMFCFIFIALVTRISFTYPLSSATPVSETVRGWLALTPAFQAQEVTVYEYVDPPLFELQAEVPKPDPPRPYGWWINVMGGRPLEDCSCMSHAQQRDKEMLGELPLLVRADIMTLEEADRIRLETPKPVEPAWCEATLNRARYHY